MPVVIIAAAEDMRMFHPDQAMVMAETAILESLDEVFEKEARDRRVDDSPRRGILPGDIEGRTEQFLEIGGLQWSHSRSRVGADRRHAGGSNRFSQRSRRRRGSRSKSCVSADDGFPTGVRRHPDWCSRRR